MPHHFPRLFNPLPLGSKSAANRIVSTAHGEHICEGGLIPDALVRYHARRAAGGAGLLIVFGSATVSRNAASNANVSLWDHRNEARLTELANAVHAHGSLIMAQASHRGPRESLQSLDDVLQVPSPLPGSFATGYRGVPHVLDKDEIREIVEAYAEAAARLERCGFDGIELTSLGTHLIEQFWSPVLNTRGDEYGGDFENRMRFSLEVLHAVADRVSPEFLIGFRISGDLATSLLGLTPADIMDIAKRLDGERLIHFFDVSAGSGANTSTHAAAVPTDTFPVGTYLEIAKRMRQALSVPVIAAGRILTPAQAESALEASACDLVAMTRALIADPDLPKWANRGEPARTRPCIAINEGCRRVTMNMSLACSVNPAVANIELDKIEPASTPRRIAVIGGGPAGLEAARVAAQRGHIVTLYEQHDRVGGQMHAYAAIPGRPHLLGHVNWLEQEVERLGVEMRLSTRAAVDHLQETDAVVIATGAVTALAPEVLGLINPVMTDEELLLGKRRIVPGTHVVVFDLEGRVRGAHAALLAARQGARRVQFAFPNEMACANLEPPNRPAIFRDFSAAGIEICAHLTLLPSREGRMRWLDTWSEREHILDSDITIVLAGYRHAQTALIDAIRKTRSELETHVAGDCLSPRLLRNAVADGVRIGMLL